MQDFNQNTLVSKMIKELLATNYIPTASIWRPGKKIIKNFTYITKEYIVKAINDFNNVQYPIQNDTETQEDFLIRYNNWQKLQPSGPTDRRYFKIINTYIFGKHYKGITTNFISNSSIYDSQTHYYLGEYLRAYRDLFDIDLLPYYNCWAGAVSDTLRIKGISATSYVLDKNNEINDNLKMFLVPIRFNQEYTIYLNSPSETLFYLAYCKENKIIREINNNRIIDRIKEQLGSFKKVGLSHNQPIKLTINIDSSFSSYENTEIDLYKNYLTLLIQTNDIFDLKLTVTEGDYTDNKVFRDNNIKEVIIGRDNAEAWEQDEIRRYFNTSMPSILNQAFGMPFSNRLIEYLLLNVITEDDDISDNIARIQDYITSSQNKLVNKKQYIGRSFARGVWDNNLRKYIYDNIINNPSGTVFDVNGYLDKDSERVIMRGYK